MKEFSLEQIESTRNYFETQNFTQENADLDGDQITYFVVPQAVNPDLPDFALRLTNTDPETGTVEGVYGVSDSVPAEIRPYWVAHEIIEFAQIGVNTEGRCASAEREILQKIPTNLLDEYIDRRIKFFTNLITYFNESIQRGEESYTEDDIAEAKGTLLVLESLNV